MNLNKFFSRNKILLASVLLLTPFIASAYSHSPYFVGPTAPGEVVTERQDPYFVGPHAPMDFKGFVQYIIGSVINPLFGLIIGFAVVFFMWNMFGAIKSADQSEERSKMKERALWGLVGIFVMVSMWGLVGFLSGSLKLSNAPLRLEQFE